MPFGGAMSRRGERVSENKSPVHQRHGTASSAARSQRQPMPRSLFSALVIVSCVGIGSAACSRGNAPEHVRRGNAYFDAGRFSEAIIEYRTALQSDPKLDVRLKLGDAYMRVNDTRNALRE